MLGIIGRTGQQLTRCLQPVLREPGLQRRHGWTSNPNLRIPPMPRRLGMTEPHIGDPRAAGEPDATVDDQRFAMRAVIELTDGVPANAVVPGQLASALLERLENLRTDRCRTNRIEQDLDRNP